MTGVENKELPHGANPNAGMYSIASVNFFDKIEREKGYSMQEKNQFSVVCKLGAQQLFRCYDWLDEFVTPGGMIERCAGCRYCCAKRRIDAVEMIKLHSERRFPNFIAEKFCEDICDPKDAKSFVYFISDGEYVKIGKADSIEKRLRSLKTGNPRELKVLARIPFSTAEKAHEAEQTLHFSYSMFHVSGEWFNILNYIFVECFSEMFNGDLEDAKGENE